MPLSFFRQNSLKSRLLLSAIFMIIVILPLVGLLISNAYQQHMESAIKNELTAYSYSLLAVAEFENGQLIMPEALTESRFNTSQSGLYATITQLSNGQNLWQSASLLALNVPRRLPVPAVGNNTFASITLERNPHFIYSFSASFTDDIGEHEITIHVIQNKAAFIELMDEFRGQIALGLIVLMLVLLLSQYAWLQWSLKPLHTLTDEIHRIEQGKSKQLEQEYPIELEQVTEQINTLLQTEQVQRTRYRNALSDLAHSLKTPLAVLQGQVNIVGTSLSQEQIDVMNLMIEHQLKRAQSAGQSAWHLGIEIEPTLKKLTNSLQKIYRDKQLSMNVNLTEDAIFKGDEADLLEILGNLLDNACKAAHSSVSIAIVQLHKCLEICVQDDGQGIAEEKIELILQRGKRADTYSQGHGIGLAIVRDLVDSYKGELHIGSSSSLGGAKFTLRFEQ